MSGLFGPFVGTSGRIWAGICLFGGSAMAVVVARSSAIFAAVVVLGLTRPSPWPLAQSGACYLA